MLWAFFLGMALGAFIMWCVVDAIYDDMWWKEHGG